MCGFLHVQEAWGKDDTIVYLMLWSDKMAFDKAGRQTGHPLTVSLGMLTLISQI